MEDAAVAGASDLVAEAADLMAADPPDLAAGKMDLVATVMDTPNLAAAALADESAREESPTSPIQQGASEVAPSPPPGLVDDVISAILLRISPEDPACLVRASLVCKSWCHLLSDGAFIHRYRTFHQTPPVLGFFQDLYTNGTCVPEYVPTIQASPVPQPVIVIAGSPTSPCHIFDCRHGRVLFQDGHQSSLRFTVWDPITGDKKCISPPAPVHPWLSQDEFSAAVLCAVDGCDHLRCCGGPFMVVIAGVYDIEELEDDEDGDAEGGYVAWASSYSSETGVWSASTAINVDYVIDIVLPSFLGSDAIYFILENGERILKYGLVSGVLSVINAPPQHEPNMIFASVQDGELGAATVEGYSLHLWLWRVTDSEDGTAEWVRLKVIELDVMITISIGNPSTTLVLAGFAEGTGSIFISANVDLFTVELKSGKITKIGKRTSDCPIFPFVSFYTPDLLTAGLQVPMRTN